MAYLCLCYLAVRVECVTEKCEVFIVVFPHRCALFFSSIRKLTHTHEKGGEKRRLRTFRKRSKFQGVMEGMSE